MKSTVFILMFLVITGCKMSSVSTKTQVPTLACVKVAGDMEKYEGVFLYMQYDDQPKFPIELMKEKTSKLKVQLYDISPGTHEIKIYSGDTLIINTKSFISNQETKEIILP